LHTQHRKYKQLRTVAEEAHQFIKMLLEQYGLVPVNVYNLEF